MKIAIAQFKISHDQPQTNIERSEVFIRRAAAKKADVIIFPEDMLTGSIFGDHSKISDGAEFKNTFQNFARKYQIDIIPGSYLEKTANGIFNTAIYIDSTGKILSSYNKINLYISERDFVTPGRQLAVFDTKFGRAALAICWDIMHPELFRDLARQGVEIVYCPSYWWKEIAGANLVHDKMIEEKHVDAICVARSVENNLVMVYANAAGKMKNPDGTYDTLIGHSQITTPLNGALMRANHNRETLIVGEINLSDLNISENIYKLGADLNK